MRYILLYWTIYLISAKYYMLKVRLDNCLWIHRRNVWKKKILSNKGPKNIFIVKIADQNVRAVPCTLQFSDVSVSCTAFNAINGVDRQLQGMNLLCKAEGKGHFRQYTCVLRGPTELHICSGMRNTCTEPHDWGQWLWWCVLMSFSTWNSQRKWFWPVHTGGRETAVVCSTKNCMGGCSSAETNE